MSIQLSEKQKELKKKFIERRGHWPDNLERLLILDEAFFETYVKFTSIPWKSGVLDPKIKDLISIAINASSTHLYEPGLRTHVRNALQLGATKEEIMEVLELTSAIGMHTPALGVPILVEESEHSRKKTFEPLSEKQIQLKKRFIKEMGYWNEFRENLVALKEDYFEAYLDLLSFPWKNGVLEPKIKEFIYIAIDSQTTHLYELGLRAHVKRALKFGATMEEIMEVYELASAQGLQTVEMGASILFEELEKEPSAN
ncbi:gamma-carboxymuconolactone decarboxylase [Pueribacillus theae]|uniref:Gamma-carboxymuconolactone decarboxylase n=1 Tax=Pueribacillus theae TaxID=2171751 RepID=A0A2U1JRM6_9BACI|nr:carboxymuconolactone decarboxylase family protein [Pueribacillus theae]PWA07821.1 gamma-carboxymuconolactone decarboxylase [Pueribacillus theae]